MPERLDLAIRLIIQAVRLDRYDRDARHAGEITYSYFADGRFSGRATVDATTRHSLLGRLYTLADEAGIDGWTAKRTAALTRLGRQLYTLFVPSETRRLVFENPQLALVALDVQDHDVPWELLHDGRDFISRRLAMGRFLVGPTPGVEVDGRKSIRVLVVGNATSDLPSSQAESEAVRAVSNARLQELSSRFSLDYVVELLAEGEATKDAVFLDRLADPAQKVDLFHFAGHVRTNRRDPERSALILADGEIYGYEARHITGEPIVFVNGCRAGAQSADDNAVTFGSIAGLAAEFMTGGALAYIGVHSRVGAGLQVPGVRSVCLS